MKSNQVKNMTIGNPTKLILWFALPMLLGNLFQQLYNLVDCIIVGKYVSANALAAVGATGSVVFLVISISNGIGNGIGIVAAQYFGAKDDVRVRKTIANSVYVVGAVGIVMSVLGYFAADPFLRLLDTPVEYVEDSIRYMQIVCGLSLATIAYNTVSALLRALGDSKTPLIFLVVASLVNVGLDLVFVLRFKMGVSGVALATVIAQMTAAVGSILYAWVCNPYFRVNAEERKPDKEIIRRSFSIGTPMAFMSSMIALSCIALQWVVNGFGPVVGAANTAISKIEQLVQQPFASLGVALSNFSGQNLGAGKKERIRQGFMVGVKTVVIISVVMFFVAQLFGSQIIGVFIDTKKSPEVIVLGAKALRITSCFYFMLGMIYITRGVLNGIGDNTFAMINGVTELGCRVGIAKPLTLVPSVGKWGIWITTGMTWFITGGVSLLRYFVKLGRGEKRAPKTRNGYVTERNIT